MVPMRLNSIVANRHIFDGQVNGKPLRLLLNFDHGNALRLQVAANGEQIIVDDGPLDVPFGMDEYGEMDVADVTQSLFPALQDLEVAQVETLAVTGKRVGVKLSLPQGEAFHFWVDSDELYWGDSKALANHDWMGGSVPTTSEHIQI